VTPPGTVQYGISTVTTDVIVVIEDIDDNSPMFNTRSFHGTLKENAAADIPVTFVTKIDVSDADTVKESMVVNQLLFFI